MLVKIKVSELANEIIGMALSPMQDHLYFGLDFTENLLAWFDRDVATISIYLIVETQVKVNCGVLILTVMGSLTLVDQLRDLPEEHPASQFYCANSLTVSDNDHLFYIADGCSDNL